MVKNFKTFYFSSCRLKPERWPSEVIFNSKGNFRVQNPCNTLQTLTKQTITRWKTVISKTILCSCKLVKLFLVSPFYIFSAFLFGYIFNLSLLSFVVKALDWNRKSCFKISNLTVLSFKVKHSSFIYHMSASWSFLSLDFDLVCSPNPTRNYSCYPSGLTFN